jgi:hypothetical protein
VEGFHHQLPTPLGAAILRSFLRSTQPSIATLQFLVSEVGFVESQSSPSLTLPDQQDHHSTRSTRSPLHRSTRPPDALRELQLHWAAKQPKLHQYQPGSQSPIIPRFNRITKRRVSGYRLIGLAASHLGRHHPLGLSFQPSSSARTEPISNQGALNQPTSSASTELPAVIIRSD